MVFNGKGFKAFPRNIVDLKASVKYKEKLI